MFYATQNANGDVIDENAEIHAFDTRAAAEAFLRKPYDDGSGLEDGETFAAVAGYFGDCWIKAHSVPARADVRPFSFDDLIIYSPGEHPGGKCFWLTPCDAVLVAKISGGEAA